MLRVEFAIAVLLLAPLVGYAVAFLLIGGAGQVTRATPAAPAHGVLRSVSQLAAASPKGNGVSIQDVSAAERGA